MSDEQTLYMAATASASTLEKPPAPESGSVPYVLAFRRSLSTTFLSTAEFVMASLRPSLSAALISFAKRSGSFWNFASATNFPKWMRRERAWMVSTSHVAAEP
jgi:hypothetical protein